MNRNTTMILNARLRGALRGIRRHPVSAAAICVPLVAAICVPLVAPSVFTGTTMASAQPAVSLEVPASALSAAPDQHVLIFANHLTGRKVTGMNSKAAVKEPPNLDGCDHDYGAAGQCVPWQIPAATPAAACAWLRSMGFGPLQVVGVNRQNLPEINGYVCVSGS